MAWLGCSKSKSQVNWASHGTMESKRGRPFHVRAACWMLKIFTWRLFEWIMILPCIGWCGGCTSTIMDSSTSKLGKYVRIWKQVVEEDSYSSTNKTTRLKATNMYSSIIAGISSITLMYTHICMHPWDWFKIMVSRLNESPVELFKFFLTAFNQKFSVSWLLRVVSGCT